jgi:hypothetical protein
MIRLVSAALVAATLLSALALGTVGAASPHAPSFAHRTYLRVPATQATRDWAWRQLGTRQWLCLDAIGHYESGWRVRAGNPDGSYGIFQSYPAAKMRRYGADYLTSAMTQTKFGIAYAKARYGTPCKAWAFWQVHHWW